MMRLLKPKGFTLIEIMCVLLIISLIALIAYPNYISYVYKSNRLDAHNSLFHYQALWQQCLLNTPDAAECLHTVGLGGAHSQISLSGYYEISASIDEPIIIFIAKPVLSQSKDTLCTVFLLDSLGQMKAYDDKQQETSQQCW